MKKQLLILILLLPILNMIVSAGDLNLAADGKTSYVIIAPPQSKALDLIAAKDLQKFLQQSTSADFQLVPLEKASGYQYRILVGAEAANLVDPTLTARLADQEAIVKTYGNDLILLGEGTHGTSYAVYAFLKRQLGCRWFTPYGDESVPGHQSLSVKPLEYRLKPDFRYRNIMLSYYYRNPDSGLFFFRNGINEAEIGLPSKTYPELRPNSDILKMNAPNCHTLFSYLPPEPKYDIWKFGGNFFTTNPEYYGMNAKGERALTMQLCFSNPEMRKVLTERVIRRIKQLREIGLVSISAMDWGEAFCLCPNCRELTKKYETSGGPLFDYLIELCNQIKAPYPKVKISTLAYRKKQSEIPPKIKGKLPENLFIIFAPIDDDLSKDWTDPGNRSTYQNLQQWCRIAENVMVWYYPHIYNWGAPFLALDRMTTDIKLMKKAGVTGVFFQHTVGLQHGYNFAEMMPYIIANLYFDTNSDVNALVREFTDAYYGNAAPLVREYAADLQLQCRRIPYRLHEASAEGMFPYLTPKWLMHWNAKFDEMEKLCADQPDPLARVHDLRQSLDLAILGYKYKRIKKEFPNTPEVETIRQRLVEYAGPALEKRGRSNELKGRIEFIQARADIAAGNAAKLPAPLTANDEKNAIQIFLPRTTANTAGSAMGWARSNKLKTFPFNIGIFNRATQKGVIGRKIEQKDIKPDRFHAYKMGRTSIPYDCYVHYLAYYQYLHDAYDAEAPQREYDVYASLKFEGPTFGSPDATEDLVWFDRLILIPVK